MVSWFRVPALIVTLGMLSIARGMLLRYQRDDHGCSEGLQLPGWAIGDLSGHGGSGHRCLPDLF